MVSTIHCRGSNYEIGLTHGHSATAQIRASIVNYRESFRASGISQAHISSVTQSIEATIKSKTPHLYKEIQGISEGSGQPVEDVVMLNARSEIMLTTQDSIKTGTQPLLLEGCSTFGQVYNDQVWAAQNWDWSSNQKEQLVHLFIEPEGKPRCHIMTEAGLVGKIGLNEYGVTVNLNAIKAKDLEMSNLPLHVLLRLPLEHRSRLSAISTIQSLGAASVGHVMISDASGVSSFETNPQGEWAVNRPDEQERVFHTNHLIVPGATMQEVLLTSDSLPRLERLKQLVENNIKTSQELQSDFQMGSALSYEALLEIFKDDGGSTRGICRRGDVELPIETIFFIATNCTEKKAMVAVGLPSEPKEWLELSFS